MSANRKESKTTARDEILARIRRALGERATDPESGYAAIQRLYHINSASTPATHVEIFVDRLQDYNATVYRCRDKQIAQAIAYALSLRDKRSMVIPRAFPSDWLPRGFEFRDGTNMTYEELDRSEGVLTGCAVAIASTGTIVLQHSMAQGHRALTLIPDYHLCVVREIQITESVPEGIRALGAFAHDPLTTVSGPSATSDIEMTRVKGVHGPRTLDVIIVGQTVRPGFTMMAVSVTENEFQTS